jgi:hypothetical protein
MCFIGLGNKKLPIQQRIYSFHKARDLSKHFKRKHLGEIEERQHLKCKLCQVDLDSKIPLQRHAHDVHVTVSMLSHA